MLHACYILGNTVEVDFVDALRNGLRWKIMLYSFFLFKIIR